MVDLFRSDNVVVRSVPADDVSRWVVTFDNFGMGHGFDRPGFGEAFLKKAGVSAIHVMGRREDCYQYPEMAEAMATVRRATAGAERVMTYGSSMGGYGALRFADAAGANAVLAISPLYSGDPVKVPFEKRWIQHAHRLTWLPEIDGRLAITGSRPLIVFDATGDDLRHVRLILSEIGADLVELPYVNHPATTYLGEVGLLAPLVAGVLQGDLNLEGFRAGAEAGRKDSVVYLSRLADLQPAWRPRIGRDLAARALARSPDNAVAMLTLAARLTAIGEHDEAIALHEKATTVGQRSVVYLTPHAIALMNAGRMAEALALTTESVEQLPLAAHLWNLHSHAYSLVGDAEGAITAMARAAELDPYEPHYTTTLARLRAERAG